MSLGESGPNAAIVLGMNTDICSQPRAPRSVVRTRVMCRFQTQTCGCGGSGRHGACLHPMHDERCSWRRWIAHFQRHACSTAGQAWDSALQAPTKWTPGAPRSQCHSPDTHAPTCRGSARRSTQRGQTRQIRDRAWRRQKPQHCAHQAAPEGTAPAPGPPDLMHP